MANGGQLSVETGDIISEQQRSQLVSDPNVLSVTTTPADNGVEVQDIRFRTPEQDPTRDDQPDQDTDTDNGQDTEPDRDGPTRQEQLAQREQQFEQAQQQLSEQLSTVQSLPPSRQVTLGDEQLTALQAEQRLQEQQQQLEQTEQAIQQARTEETTQLARIDGDIEAIAVQQAETEPFDPEPPGDPAQIVETPEPDLVQDPTDTEPQPVTDQPTEQETRQALATVGTPFTGPEQLQLAQQREQIEDRIEQTEQIEAETQQQLESVRQLDDTQQVRLGNRVVEAQQAEQELEQRLEEQRATRESLETGREQLQAQIITDISQDRPPLPTDEAGRTAQQRIQQLQDMSDREVFAAFGAELAETTVQTGAELAADIAEAPIEEGLGIDVRRPQIDTREQFQELSPELIVAQERLGERFAQGQQALEQRIEATPGITQQDVGEIIGGTVAGATAVAPFIPGAEQAAADIVTSATTARAIGEEIPEKLTELAGGAAVVERLEEAPGQTLSEAGTGAGIIAGQAAEAPGAFIQQEIVPDVGLDILVGGAVAPTVVPSPETVTQAGTRAQQLGSQIRDQFGQTRTGQLGTTETVTRPEPDVVADPGPDIGPTPTTPQIEPEIPVIDTVEPVTSTEPQPQVQAQPRVRAQPRPQPVSRPDAVTADIEEAIGRPDAVTEPVTEPFAQPQVRAQPQVQAATVPESVAQVQTQAVPQTVAQPRPQTRPVTLPDIEQDFEFDRGQAGQDQAADRGLGRTPSVGALLTGQTVEAPDVDQEVFTGLEQRPIISEPDDDTDEEELSNLF